MADATDHECSGALFGEELDTPGSRVELILELVESVRDHALILLDLHGNVDSWHDGAQAIMGYEANEIIGAHFSRLYTPEAVAGGRPELEAPPDCVRVQGMARGGPIDSM